MTFSEEDEDLIQVEEKEGGFVARCLESEVTMFSLPEIRQTLLGIIKDEPKFLILDFSETTFLDSSGIAMIFKVFQEVRKYGGSFFVTGLKATLKKVMTAVVTDQDEIRFIETVEEALEEV